MRYKIESKPDVQMKEILCTSELRHCGGGGGRERKTRPR